jgi:ankyrin repeat protein
VATRRKKKKKNKKKKRTRTAINDGQLPTQAQIIVPESLGAGPISEEHFQVPPTDADVDGSGTLAEVRDLGRGSFEFHEACLGECGADLPVVSLLLERGFDPNLVDLNGRSPLRTALENSDLALASLLLQKGANVETFDKAGASLLHTAYFFGNMEFVELFLAIGADVHALWRGRTVVSFACENGDEIVVKYARDKRKLDPNEIDNDDFRVSLIQHACRNGHIAIADLLWNEGADFRGVHFAPEVQECMHAIAKQKKLVSDGKQSM